MKGYVWNSNKRKVLVVILCLSLVLGGSGANFIVTAAEDTFTGISNQKSGDLTWSITPDGKLTISGTGNYVKNAEDRYNGYNPSWYAYKDYILTAEVSVTGITSMERMFHGLSNLTSIVFKNTDASQVTTMEEMFTSCESLQMLDLSGLDTRNVKNMRDMFNMCITMESVNVKGKFSTASVTDMSNMFANCNELSTLDVSGFDTNKVTDMSSMFAGCETIQTLDVSNFNTSNVTDMGGMFGGCYDLETLTLGSSFQVNKVEYMNNMFIYCYSLKEIDLSTFHTSLNDEGVVTDMSGMFYHCRSLTSAIFPKDFDTSNVEDMAVMFYQCRSLKKLDISGFDTSKVKRMNQMFDECISLEQLDISSFNTSSVKEMHYMFRKCKSLQSLDLSNFNTENVTSMYAMFDGCNTITELDLSSFDTSKYTSDTEFVLKMNNLVKITTGKDKRAYKLVTDAENWIDDKGNMYLDDTTIEPDSNTTLYAHSGSFDITYIYDGELVDAQATYNMGEALSLSGYVTKKYYIFDGWYEDEGLTKKITEISADRYGDINLYAKMNPVTYNIAYRNVDDASNVELLPTNYTYNENLELKSPAKICHQFDGWYLDKELIKKITAITPGTFGDIILYGKWTECHDLDKENGTVIKEATTNIEGEICYKCRKCNYTESEKIPCIVVNEGQITEERPVTDKYQITDETILNKTDDGDIKGSDFTKFQARANKTMKHSIGLKWNKLTGADGYKIYGNKCGKKNRYKFITNIKNGNKTKWTQKKLKKGTYYKFIVRAYQLVDGEEVTLAVSKTIHATTTGGKYGVAKSVKIKTDKKMKRKKGNYTLTIKKSKKYTIKASEVKGVKKIRRHRKIAFDSNDKNIATISSKGVVKAKKSGNCYIYAYAQNGVYKRIKVVVK